MAGLPPPPINDRPGSFTWLEWYRQLRAYVSTSGSVPWYIINFSGSNITDIAARDHADLQGKQGGTAGEHYHLDSADYTNLTGGTPTFDTVTVNDNLVLSNTAGEGIKLNPASPAFGWKDLIGDTVPKTFGVGAPTLSTWRGDIRWFAYNTADDGDIIFHLPHDYAPGTDLFLHVHWGHNGTNISGSIDVRFHLSYAKGHGQANFPADVEPHLVISSLNITNTPQYNHRVDEIQISASSPSGTQIDTDDIEPDGVLMVHFDLDTIPTITGGSPNQPFIFAIDLHYQATNLTTKNKTPNFYS